MCECVLPTAEGSANLWDLDYYPPEVGGENSRVQGRDILWNSSLILFVCFNPHLRICFLLILERETLMWETNIHQFPLIWDMTGGWTCNPGMCPHWESNLQLLCVCVQMTLQPAKPPGQGPELFFFLVRFCGSIFISSLCCEDIKERLEKKDKVIMGKD